MVVRRIDDRADERMSLGMSSHCRVCRGRTTSEWTERAVSMAVSRDGGEAGHGTVRGPGAACLAACRRALGTEAAALDLLEREKLRRMMLRRSRSLR